MKCNFPVNFLQKVLQTSEIKMSNYSKNICIHVFFVVNEILQEFWQRMGFFLTQICQRSNSIWRIFDNTEIPLELKNTNTQSFYLVLQKWIASFKVMQATTTVKLYTNISLSYHHYDKWYLISRKHDYTL